MTGESTGQDSFFAEDERPAPEPSETLIVDVDGYEGPLDLLLAMARDQKVDLARISILALVEQYLVFIAEARRLSLELAADYLVMAAWLAYLKSRLLLPAPEDDDEPTGEELAAHLAFRLKRLDVMRDATRQLLELPQLGVDRFARGMPEGIRQETTPVWQDTLYDLLAAYARERIRNSVTEYRIERRQVMTLTDARALLLRFAGQITVWAPIDRLLIEYAIAPGERRSALASSFSASLELVREGAIEMKQERAFSPLLVRSAARISGV